MQRQGVELRCEGRVKPRNAMATKAWQRHSFVRDAMAKPGKATQSIGMASECVGIVSIAMAGRGTDRTDRQRRSKSTNCNGEAWRGQKSEAMALTCEELQERGIAMRRLQGRSLDMTCKGIAETGREMISDGIGAMCIATA